MSKLDGVEAAALERKAAKVADVLRAIGNERRLLILCKLVVGSPGTELEFAL